jgi:hypothetical protein
MRLLREPAAYVIVQARLMQLVRSIAPVLGLTLRSTLELTRSVIANLTDNEPDDADDVDRDDGNLTRLQ